MSKKFTFDIEAMKSMGGAEYAASEAWDIMSASSAINMIAQLAMSEVKEPDDVQSLGNIILSLMEFINGEIKEMVAAARRGVTEDADPYAMMSKSDGTLTTTNNYHGTVYINADNQQTKQFTSGFVQVVDKPVIESVLDLSYVKSLGVDIPDNRLAVKYVSKNTIAHPVFIWGDAKKTDLELEYFTKNSDFWDEALKNVNRPLTWEHGQDKKFAEFESNPVIGQTVKYYDDDIARWAESVITTDKQYRKYIDQFIEEKRLGYSSDSAPQYVIREKQGKATWLKMWPWFGGSLTASPCEPRMKVYTPEFLKSLGILLPDTSSESETWMHEMAILDFYKMKYTK